MKRVMALSLLVSLLLVAVSCSVPGWVEKDIDRYEQRRDEIPYAKGYLPALDALSDAKTLEYRYKRTTLLIFESHGVSLIASYDKEVYEREKAKTLVSYPVIDDTYVSSDGTLYLSMPASFSYRGYDFVTVYDEESQGTCKSFLLLGFDDAASQIAYCYFYDMDLDYIASVDESPEAAAAAFLDEYFVLGE